MSLLLPLLLPLACALTDGTPVDAPPAPEPAVEVRTDLDALRTHIPVPDGVTAARWAGRPRGAIGLGPTDLELLAYFPLDEEAWGRLAPSLGDPGEQGSFQADPTLLVVIPAAERDDTGVKGRRYPATAFENIRWSATWAVRTEGGLAVHLFSR
ncbi:MAG: hypothetical protein ABIO70_21825 [Pseudomonadota bacterium]